LPGVLRGVFVAVTSPKSEREANSGGDTVGVGGGPDAGV
jgi:hypothetical protein